MPTYQGFPLETDPSALAEDAISWLEARWPWWRGSPANFDAGSIEAHARMIAELRDIAANHPDEIFARIGELSGIPRIAEASASVFATVTAIDAQGYTLEAGTVVGIRASGDVVARFEVADPVVIAPGTLSTSSVLLTASESGTAANDLGAAGTVGEIIDRTVPWATVTLLSATSGGADAESFADYLDRIVEELELQAPRPILPRDFAVFARRDPSVDRALAVDLYQPAPPYGPVEASNIARCVTVYVVDSAGLDPGETVRSRVRADLLARRESTFLIYVAPPTYAAVIVSATVKAEPGFEASDVEARSEAALSAYLNPADWGVPRESLGREWSFSDRIRRTELYEVLNAVDGVDYVEDTLTINGQAVDLLLTGGRVVLPQPGVMSVTVI